MANKQRLEIGDLVQIPLSKNRFGYGQLLGFNQVAIFSICQREEITPEFIQQSKILFVIAVYKQAINHGKWKKIGKSFPVLEKLPLQFIQDMHQPGIIQLYQPETGRTTPATREDCMGLERCAVWEAYQVAERIQDYFDGKENQWENQLKLI